MWCMHACVDACRFSVELAEGVEKAKAAVRMDDEAAFKVLKDVARTELVRMINAARNKGALPSKRLKNLGRFRREKCFKIIQTI
jgi:hypothetical protein